MIKKTYKKQDNQEVKLLSTEIFDEGGGKTLDKLVAETDWVYPTLQNGWENYNGASDKYVQARYKMKNGVVYIEGLIRYGESKNDDGLTPIFTLPVGFRPNRQLCFITTSSAATCCNRVDIYPTGAVQSILGDNDYLSLCISFVPDQ